MNRTHLKYFLAFVAGAVVASCFATYLYLNMVKKLEEDRFLDMAVQIRWQLAELRGLQEKKYQSVEEDLEQQILFQKIMFEPYVQSYSGKFETEYSEVQELLRQFSESSQ